MPGHQHTHAVAGPAELPPGEQAPGRGHQHRPMVQHVLDQGARLRFARRRRPSADCSACRFPTGFLRPPPADAASCCRQNSRGHAGRARHRKGGEEQHEKGRRQEALAPSNKTAGVGRQAVISAGGLGQNLRECAQCDSADNRQNDRERRRRAAWRASTSRADPACSAFCAASRWILQAPDVGQRDDHHGSQQQRDSAEGQGPCWPAWHSRNPTPHRSPAPLPASAETRRSCRRRSWPPAAAECRGSAPRRCPGPRPFFDSPPAADCPEM